MRAFWAAIWARVVAWFRKRKPITPAAPLKVEPPAERYKAVKLRQSILEKLDKYQVYIRRLKKYDPTSYRQYRRLGAYIISSDLEIADAKLNKAFMQLQPGFGAFALNVNGDEDSSINNPDKLITTRFAYFTKLERPGADVQPVNRGVVYRARFYIDDRVAIPEMFKGRDRGTHMDILLNLTKDGEIHALRVLNDQAQVIKHKRGGSTTIHHKKWGYHKYVYKKGRDPAEHCISLFTCLANFWLIASQHSMIRVTATKDRIVMPFSVDVLHTPQFFADRERIPTENGRRQRPIFHIVRSHDRIGTRSGVKMHFAGLREFQWNGYQVRITVPGKDHFDLTEVPLGAFEDVTDEERASGKFISTPAVANKIADLIGAPL
jgi:hypothetical protein